MAEDASGSVIRSCCITELSESIAEMIQDAIQGASQGEEPYGQGDAFGAILKAARESAGLSQKELAGRAGVREFTVAQIEAGIKEPTPAQRAKLDDALPELAIDSA